MVSVQKLRSNSRLSNDAAHRPGRSTVCGTPAGTFEFGAKEDVNTGAQVSGMNSDAFIGLHAACNFETGILVLWRGYYLLLPESHCKDLQPFILDCAEPNDSIPELSLSRSDNKLLKVLGLYPVVGCLALWFCKA